MTIEPLCTLEPAVIYDTVIDRLEEFCATLFRINLSSVMPYRSRGDADIITSLRPSIMVEGSATISIENASHMKRPPRPYSKTSNVALEPNIQR